MSLYYFIILRKKKETPTRVFSCGIHETFKNSGGCFWKHVYNILWITNYVGHKLAIFNAVLLLFLHLLKTQWWDMRLEQDLAWLWDEQADSSNMCLKGKEVLPKFYQRISRIIFKICFSQPNKHILEILLAQRHILLLKTVGWVLSYATGCWSIIIL